MVALAPAAPAGAGMDQLGPGPGRPADVEQPRAGARAPPSTRGGAGPRRPAAVSRGLSPALPDRLPDRAARRGAPRRRRPRPRARRRNDPGASGPSSTARAASVATAAAPVAPPGPSGTPAAPRRSRCSASSRAVVSSAANPATCAAASGWSAAARTSAAAIEAASGPERVVVGRPGVGRHPGGPATRREQRRRVAGPPRPPRGVAPVQVVGGLGDGADERAGEGRVAGEADVAAEGVEPGAGGVDPLGLAGEGAVETLAVGEADEQSLGLVVQAVVVEGHGELGGVEPADDRRGPGARVLAGAVEHGERPRGADRLDEALVGQLEPRRPTAHRLPARGDPVGTGRGAHVEGRGAVRARPAPADDGDPRRRERQLHPDRRGVREGEQERGGGPAAAAAHPALGPAPTAPRPAVTTTAQSPSASPSRPGRAPGRAAPRDDRRPAPSGRRGRRSRPACGPSGFHGRTAKATATGTGDAFSSSTTTVRPRRRVPRRPRPSSGGSRRRRGRASPSRPPARTPTRRWRTAGGPRRQVPAVVGADPPVERPPRRPGGDQAARVDDRPVGAPAVPSSTQSRWVTFSPAAGAGHHVGAARVELALEPPGRSQRSSGSSDIAARR